MATKERVRKGYLAMNLIDFQERGRLMRLQKEFRSVTEELRRTRLQLSSPLSDVKREEVEQRRQSAIAERDRLERAFDYREVETTSDVEAIRDIEGTKQKRRLLAKMPLEDLG